ncbi:MAG: zinc ribbon domain-containing protein [Lentisphaeria bacterium]|nr:zinc ribbon domain-containing protein [Lentisphaeria bacterium]
MALFNKLENFARNLGDKTSDVIETGKLNAKINSEKALAAEEWKKIGEFYYNPFASGAETAPEVLEACEAAKAHLDAAAEAQAEIDRIKAEKEAEEQARAAAYEAEKAAAESAASGTITCPECGAAVAEGKKFCGECGTKIE